MPLREEILISLETEGIPDVEEVQRAMTRLGFNLRLAGRDLMRLAGSLHHLSDWLTGFSGGVMRSSDIIQDAFGDVRYALEDIFEVTGIIDSLANSLEGLAEFLERNPWVAWMLAGLAVIGIIVLILSKIMMFLAFIKLLVGSVLSARDANMGWRETISFVTRALLFQNAALRENLSLQVRIAAYARERGISYKEAKQQVDQMYKAEEKSLKQGKKWGAGMKRLSKITLIGAGIFGALLGLFLMAEPVLEILTAAFEVIGEAIEIIIAPFEDLIWQVIAFFEANPELLAGILVAIAAAFITMKATGIVQWLKDLLGTSSTILTKTGPIRENVAGLAKDILALAAAVGILLVAVSGAVWILSQTGYTLPEIITLIGTLTIAVIILGGTFITFALLVAAAGVPLAALSPILLPLAVLLLAVGAAAFLVGAAFLLAGLGVKLACEGIASLVAYAPQVFNLGSALLVLGAALGLVALAALPAVIGIMALSAAIFALSLALIALTVPLAIIRALGGTPAVLAAIQKLPSFQKGGVVTETGIAVLHEREVVTPARGRALRERYRPKEPPLTVSVDVTGAGSVEEMIRRAVQASVGQVSEQIERRFRRREY